MTKQDLSILLVLMMLITPIASAFDHCSGMNMSGSESQSLTVSMFADEANSSVRSKMLMGHQTKMDCDSRCSCMLHVCGSYGITSLASTINFMASSGYSIVEYPSQYSIVLAPDLRPPKLILS